MQQYDIALKSLLCRKSGKLFQTLTGSVAAEWLGTELSELKAMRVDLLAKTVDDRLIHIEFQSSNNPKMHERMLVFTMVKTGCE